MNIAIFGDSFADDRFNEDEKSWVQYLRDQGHAVNNFSRGGTSLYWSYDQYLKLKNSDSVNSVDKIIFLFTSSGRITANILGKTYLIISIESFNEYLLENDLTSTEVRLLKSFRDYYESIRDLNEVEEMYKLMKKEIMADDSVIYIDSFHRGQDTDEVSLFDICFEEIKILTGLRGNLLDNFLLEYHDRRKCHISEPNNLMIGEKILKAILSNQKTVKFYKSDILPPLPKAKEYFPKR